MATLVKCIFGPRLYRVHQASVGEPGRLYRPGFIEAGGDKFIKVIHFCWSLSYWTSPVLLTVLYRRGYFSTEGLTAIAKFLISIGIIYAVSFFTRGIGRFSNPDYVTFISTLMTCERSLTEANRRALWRYDYEFWAWPVDFRWADVNQGDVKKAKVQIPRSSRVQPASAISTLPCSILSYIAIHTFGRRMVYPGTTSLMKTLISDTLIQNRAKLIEEKKGVRAKVVTEDNNEIDTMFLDRRSVKSGNGNTLVICCEGNAGFYEIGCCGTPMDLNYSILGWNHPGFGGSSGIPFPDQEQNAIDAVMQYAIHKLGFQPQNIIIFAWSIGGYSASWAAMNYPDIKYMVLDATFDDIVPLAVSKMPEVLKSIVTFALRNYMDLNIAEQVVKFPGQVLLIRRSKDEIITTEVNPGLPPQVRSNRGNMLLAKLLQYRYPKIVDASTAAVLEMWLSKERAEQAVMWSEYNVDADWCLATIRSYTEENSHSFPCHLGEDFDQVKKNQLVLFLASKYMEDFDSTHCTPLAHNFFHKPWSPHD
ncbi:phosphatidylserine lipase ABHD16A-like [Haliotis asinina]|uniref:phosphatidylserine lipase ABHD16A-like n=1 Tax=Haliotis asinina TaxID=109174 RepID=UPI003531AB24